ncbi:pseudouridine synthase [Tribonema minus]|uniref:Pseudouridine synthase n=1 Tax=Tribonema minus TaxID=303371 RepID=A0A835YQ08_9STRA|nr:pseudouridine synthase [Tribonema minus]
MVLYLFAGNVIVRASDDKAVRGDTHRGIIKACPALQTRAQVDKDGSQMIAVSWTKTINSSTVTMYVGWFHICADHPRKRKRQHELQDSSVPVAAENVLLSFVLRKENKLAITHQQCVVRGVSAKALLRTNGTIPGVQVGNFTILSRNANLLQLGEQGGNHFKIVLRNLTASHAQLRAAVEEIAHTVYLGIVLIIIMATLTPTSDCAAGFINFFGTQRIGSSAHGGAMSYQVGLQLLKGDFEGAAVLLLRPTRGSDRAAHNSPTVPTHTHSASNGTATTASDAPAVGAACTDGSIAAASTAQLMDAEASASVPAGTGSGSTDEGGAMGEGAGAETADASERDGPERAGNGTGGSRGGGLSRAAAALSKFVESARGVRDAKECLRELSGGGRHGHARERALLQVCTISGSYSSMPLCAGGALEQRVADQQQVIQTLQAAAETMQANNAKAATREKVANAEWQSSGYVRSALIRGGEPHRFRFAITKESERATIIRDIMQGANIDLGITSALVEAMWVKGVLIPDMFLSTTAAEQMRKGDADVPTFARLHAGARLMAQAVPTFFGHAMNNESNGIVSIAAELDLQQIHIWDFAPVDVSSTSCPTKHSKRHAYMWNKMASVRVSQLGPVAVAGDLIALPDGETGPPTVLGAEVPEDERRALFSRVVLPMPGRSVQYPHHCVGELYRQTIDDDGVKFDRQGYTLKGTYRPLLCMPTDMRWQLATTAADDGTASTDTAATSTDSKAALQEAVVEFALKPGAYATMALRELTKCNTDIACVPKRQGASQGS